MAEPTLVTLIERSARDRPGAPALYGRVDDGWRQLSWDQWWQASRQAAKGLITLDVQGGDLVVLVAGARAEWAVAHPAICAAGGIPILVSPEESSDTLAAILAISRARIVIVEGTERLEQVLEHRSDPGVALSHVITLDRFRNRGDRVLDLDSLMERGASMPSVLLEERTRRIQGDDVALKQFSGDSEKPWLDFTHSDLVAASRRQLSALGEGPCVVFNSVAPVTPNTVVCTLGIAAASGGELWFTPDARGLTDARPHVALLCPKHWKEVLNALEIVADDTGGWRGGLVSWSRLQARSHTDGWTSAVAKTFLNPVLENCGLLETVGYSAAPLDPAVRDELASLGVSVQRL